MFFLYFYFGLNYKNNKKEVIKYLKNFSKYKINESDDY